MTGCAYGGGSSRPGRGAARPHRQPGRRRTAHQAAATELDLVEADLLDRLGLLRPHPR
ncbi:MAG TPA: hypothetical protein VHH34_05290 [Pseudonocardiaceae bacterium]|nr:hypothetical protein [Pseudonocardiaceae bacterium]